MDRQNPFNVPAKGFQFMLSMLSCLILKLNSPSGTSFGLYFANEEYRANDSKSRAERNVSPAADMNSYVLAASTEIVSGIL